MDAFSLTLLIFSICIFLMIVVVPILTINKIMRAIVNSFRKTVNCIFH